MAAGAARDGRPRRLAGVPSPALVLGAIASLQIGSALATTAFAAVGPAGVVCLRLLFGALILSALARPRLRGLSRAQLGLACLFGLVLGMMNLAFYESIDRIPLGIAVSIEFVGPLGVALLGSRRALDVLWAALAGLGILSLTRGGGQHLDTLGVSLALLAGCLWGLYIVLNARLGREFPDADGLTLSVCVAAAAILPLGVASAGSSLLRGDVLVVGLAVGLLSSAVPYSLEVEALRRIAPPVFGVLMSLEPGMAALAGLVILGQALSGRTVIGIALVVAASIGASRNTSRSAPVPQ